MGEYDETNDEAIDLREETLVTRHPGYVSTEHAVRDVAAERRIRFYLFNRILWSLLVFLEILLALRFILRMIQANPDSGFAVFMYGITGIFVGPFNGLVATPTSGGIPLEITTFIAMIVYALLVLCIAYGIRLIVDRPSARSFTLQTRQQTPGGTGNERITHTTISDGKL